MSAQAIRIQVVHESAARIRSGAFDRADGRKRNTYHASASLELPLEWWLQIPGTLSFQLEVEILAGQRRVMIDQWLISELESV